MPQPAVKSSNKGFQYEVAFDRNIGWLTAEDQAKLKSSCVAIAGLGGAGGYQAQALARLGVGKFKIADLDTFELSNTNRQMGASTETLGQSKVEVIKKMITAINPQAEVEVYPDGVHHKNVGYFLENVQVALDGIDFFAVEAKMLFFDECYKRKILSVTSCPLGFGASVLVFDPHRMHYRAYFDLDDKMTEKEKRFSFAFGLSPTPLCLSYMQPEAMDMDHDRAASVSPGLMLVGALSTTEAVKILTGKGKIRTCPKIFQIDLMTQRVRKKTYFWGMKSPWQKLKKMIILRFLPKPSRTSS